ncbi:DUF4221 domain-containing protein [Algoriphagus kandeliae]|uniref:DUF4221 domain-containing protein n=1 Tax=Algoriphagus kandeliae TaxID=2562278 RepID=A0A4Y9QU35_9BACT|nr:DUF4221 family protein [Algoriphagus kandeliae]TFV96114.1 DUF4221 domain-containing protein [Algoriphagus kandeliae]
MKLSQFALVFLIIFSCTPFEKEANKNEADSKTISLIAEDSTVVRDVLASTFIFQDGDQEHLIFRDAPASTIYIFDRKSGDLVYKWTKTGDVPGAFSMAVSNLNISESGEIVMVDPNSGLLVFGKDGQLIKRANPVANQWSFGGAFNLFRVNELVTIKGERYLLYSLDKLEAEQEYTAEYLKNRKNLVLTNLETGEHRLILPFPEGSKFLNGKVYPFEDFRPRFLVDEIENKLIVIFQNEPILYTYSWNEGAPELLSSIRIDLPGFEENEGWEPGSIQMAQITDQENEPFPARIQGLEAVENGFLLSYSTKPTDLDNYNRYKSKERTKEGLNQIFEETRRKTVFVDLDGKVFPVDFPDMHYESFQIIDGKIHWMKKPIPGEEAEEFTVYWGELRAD